MNNTYTRHKTNTTGQLRPLEDRMTDKQYERRTMKAVTRLGREHAITRGVVMSMTSILSRGFWGKLKFAFFGK